MSAVAGSGETGRRRGVRGTVAGAALLGYIFILIAMLWATWGTDNKSWSPSSLPHWYVAAADVVPEDLQHAAARGMCALAVLANSKFEGGPCRDSAPNRAGAACFAADRHAWCVDQRVVASTAVWILLALILAGISRILRTGYARDTSVAEWSSRWTGILLNGLVGMMMLGLAYQRMSLGDVVIFDRALDFDPRFLDDFLKQGCAVRTGHCVIDISSKTPDVLLWIAIGIVILWDVLETAYKRRREFFRPEIELKERG
jgi:hypothetical protein